MIKHVFFFWKLISIGDVEIAIQEGFKTIPYEKKKKTFVLLLLYIFLKNVFFGFEPIS